MKEIYNGQTVALGGSNLVTKELVVDDSTGEKAEFTYDKTTGAIAVQDEVDEDSVNPVTSRAVAKAIEQGGGGGSDLPEYTAADEGKVLGVVVSGVEQTADIEWVEPQGAGVVEVQYSSAATMFDTVKDAYLAGQDVIIKKPTSLHKYESIFQLIGVRRAKDPETGYRTGDPDQFLFGAVDTSGENANRHMCNCVVTLSASELSYVETPILPSYSASNAGKVLRISDSSSHAPEWATINEVQLIPVSALNATIAETLYGVIGNAITAGKLPVLVTSNSTNSDDKRYWPLTRIENIADPSYGFNAYRFTVIEQVFNSGSSPMLYDLYQEDIIVALNNFDGTYNASAHRYQVATAVAQATFDPFTA